MDLVRYAFHDLPEVGRLDHIIASRGGRRVVDDLVKSQDQPNLLGSGTVDRVAHLLRQRVSANHEPRNSVFIDFARLVYSITATGAIAGRDIVLVHIADRRPYP